MRIHSPAHSRIPDGSAVAALIGAPGARKTPRPGRPGYLFWRLQRVLWPSGIFWRLKLFGQLCRLPFQVSHLDLGGISLLGHIIEPLL